MEHQRERFGVEEDIAFLIKVPVEGRNENRVLGSRLDEERLRVVFDLQSHQHGIVGVATQFEGVVIINCGAVDDRLESRDGVAGFQQFHSAACTVGGRTVDGDVALSRQFADTKKQNDDKK